MYVSTSNWKDTEINDAHSLFVSYSVVTDETCKALRNILTNCRYARFFSATVEYKSALVSIVFLCLVILKRFMKLIYFCILVTLIKMKTKPVLFIFFFVKIKQGIFHVTFSLQINRYTENLSTELECKLVSSSFNTVVLILVDTKCFVPITK